MVSWSQVATPGLVLGRSGAEPAVDRDAAARAGVQVVRRTSGGGPVLWDRDLLALDIVLPRGHPLAGDDVVMAYRWLGEAIAAALRRCGVGDVEVVGVERARRARSNPGPAADACFGGLSPFEVTAGGRKVLGLSQARRGPGTLLQAGIPLRFDAPGLARLLGRDAAWERGLAAAAAGVGELTGGVDADALVAAIDAEVADRCDVDLTPDAPTAAERDVIAAVVAERLGPSGGGA